MYSLFNLIFTVLIIGAIAHWIVIFFLQRSYRSELFKIREVLDRIYEPMLAFIRSKVKPLTLADGRSIDLSHLILVVALLILRRIAFFLF